MIHPKSIAIDYQCKICGFKQIGKPIASMTDQYVAIKCGNCDVLSAYPSPSIAELEQYYSSYPTTQERPEIDSILVELHQGILEYLLSHLEIKHNLSFLDYGFGAGAFIKLVAQKGFHAYGIELSVQNCNQLNKYCKKHNLKIGVNQVSDGYLDRFTDRKFNCITLFQVIEHALNPLELLSCLSSLQNSGGLLYLECPNNDALYLKVKNAIRKKVGRESFFDSLNPPQHLYGFNRNSIRVLLEKAGYTVIELSDYYYGDGLHQVETVFWYPSFQEIMRNKNCWNFYGISKFFIRLF